MCELFQARGFASYWTVCLSGFVWNLRGFCDVYRSVDNEIQKHNWINVFMSKQV